MATFNFDPQAERIHWTGRGWLLPPSINFTALTDALLAIKQQTGQIATRDCVLMPS